MGKSTAGSCHAPGVESKCHSKVMNAMLAGFEKRPDDFPGLNTRSNYRDFQAFFWNNGMHKCPRPCMAQEEPCVPFDEAYPCRNDVAWAAEHGLEENPEWYPELRQGANWKDIALVLYVHGQPGCPRPCDKDEPKGHYVPYDPDKEEKDDFKDGEESKEFEEVPAKGMAAGRHFEGVSMLPTTLEVRDSGMPRNVIRHAVEDEFEMPLAPVRTAVFAVYCSPLCTVLRSDPDLDDGSRHNGKISLADPAVSIGFRHSTRGTFLPAPFNEGSVQEHPRTREEEVVFYGNGPDTKIGLKPCGTMNRCSDGGVVKEDQICSVNGESEVDVMKQLLKTESEIMLEFQRRRYAEAVAN
ncbi:SLC16A12 [Symbiodinium sp. CCMP2592]|nr:SLC16A12 [Symbiodinium sp. CCMP2592]